MDSGRIAAYQAGMPGTELSSCRQPVATTGTGIGG
jgi:hypothetical protein